MKVDPNNKKVVGDGYKAKGNVYIAPVWKQELWCDFFKRCHGYSFIDTTDGKELEDVAVFCRHWENKPLLMSIAEGKKPDLYRRKSKEHFCYVKDVKDYTVRKSSQGMLDLEGVNDDYEQDLTPDDDE